MGLGGFCPCTSEQIDKSVIYRKNVVFIEVGIVIYLKVAKSGEF